MTYIMLQNLQVVLFFISLIIKSFRKVFMLYLVISSIVVYWITIILNTLDKVGNCMELRVVKDWST